LVRSFLNLANILTKMNVTKLSGFNALAYEWYWIKLPKKATNIILKQQEIP